MPPPLLLATISDVSVRAATLMGMAATLGALASVLRVWIEQFSRTRRLDRALRNSDPSQRAEIIVACSAFENKHADPADGLGAGRLRKAKKPAPADDAGAPRHDPLALRPRGRGKDR